jgi:hypothetical protein
MRWQRPCCSGRSGKPDSKHNLNEPYVVNQGDGRYAGAVNAYGHHVNLELESLSIFKEIMARAENYNEDEKFIGYLACRASSPC